MPSNISTPPWFHNRKAILPGEDPSVDGLCSFIELSEWWWFMMGLPLKCKRSFLHENPPREAFTFLPATVDELLSMKAILIVLSTSLPIKDGKMDWNNHLYAQLCSLDRK
jgi:hypothetical protein